MRWIEDPFVGNSAAENYFKTKSKIDRRKPHKMVYLLVLNKNSKSLLDIIPSHFLIQNSYPTSNLLAVGMAGSKPEAIEMISQILAMTYSERGDYNISQYIKAHHTGAS